MGGFEPSTLSIEHSAQLGIRIMEIMEEKGSKFTQQYIAQHIGMNRKTLSKKLNGERELYLFELKRIAEVLSLPLERLIGEDSQDDQRRLEYLLDTLGNKNEAYRIAKALAERVVGFSEKCITLNNLGRALYIREEYEEAFKMWVKAYSCAEKIHEKYGKTESLYNVITNLMLSFTIRKEFSSLNEYLTEDIRTHIDKILESTPQRAGAIFYSKAKVSERSGDLELAHNHYYMSLEYYSKTNHSIMIGRAKHNTAAFEYRRGNLETSRQLFEEALEDLRFDLYGRLICAKEYSKTLLKLGFIDRAHGEIINALTQIRELIPDHPDNYTDLEAQFNILLSRTVQDVQYAESVLVKEDVSTHIRRLAGRFIMNYYDGLDDCQALMKYHRIVGELHPKLSDILDEEEL